MEFAPEVLHGFAATHPIVGSAQKVTALFPSFVPHTRHGSRVNHCRLFERQRIQHHLQAYPYSQDHRPEVPLSPIVATAFIESGEERLPAVSAEKPS